MYSNQKHIMYILFADQNVREITSRVLSLMCQVSFQSHTFMHLWVYAYIHSIYTCMRIHAFMGSMHTYISSIHALCICTHAYILLWLRYMFFFFNCSTSFVAFLTCYTSLLLYFLWLVHLLASFGVLCSALLCNLCCFSTSWISLFILFFNSLLLWFLCLFYYLLLCF